MGGRRPLVRRKQPGRRHRHYQSRRALRDGEPRPWLGTPRRRRAEGDCSGEGQQGWGLRHHHSTRAPGGRAARTFRAGGRASGAPVNRPESHAVRAARQPDAPDKVRAVPKPQPLQLIWVFGRPGRARHTAIARGTAERAAVVARGHGGETRRILAWKRLEQQRVQEAEDRRVGADPQVEREYGHCGEARALQQHTSRETDVRRDQLHAAPPGRRCLLPGSTAMRASEFGKTTSDHS